MPWKNGGGETIEIAVFPEGASLDTFDWRISMASVASDGPFSEFANIDRTLSVLTGEGIGLKIGRMTYTLTQETPPLAFAGDVPTFGTLVSGPIADLNVMTRRGVCSHSVERFSGVEELVFQYGSGDLLLITMGAMTISSNEETFELSATDCLWVSKNDTQLGLKAADAATVFAIRLDTL